jgi:hypothetical protein
LRFTRARPPKTAATIVMSAMSARFFKLRRARFDTDILCGVGFDTQVYRGQYPTRACRVPGGKPPFGSQVKRTFRCPADGESLRFRDGSPENRTRADAGRQTVSIPIASPATASATDPTNVPTA